MYEMNYNINDLIDKVSNLVEFDDERCRFENLEIEFDNCIAFVSGDITATLDNDSGDYCTAPTHKLKGLTCDIDNIELAFNDRESIYVLNEIEINRFNIQLQTELER